jgi:endonuclease III
MPSKGNRLNVVLKGLERAYGGPKTLDEPRPLEQLVFLILARGSDPRRARAAMKHLESEFVDWNELRVTSVYEIRKQLAPLGASKIGNKAEEIKELLATIYERFNKLDLDFLQGVGSDPEETKKRDRFDAWLQDKSPSLWAMMALHGPRRIEVVATPALGRVMLRLGWTKTRTSSAKSIHGTFTRVVPEEAHISAQWGLYHLLETVCLPRSPRCDECPVAKECPTGVKARGDTAGKSAEAARPTRRKSGRKTAARKATARKATARKATARKTTPRKGRKTRSGSRRGSQ